MVGGWLAWRVDFVRRSYRRRWWVPKRIRLSDVEDLKIQCHFHMFLLHLGSIVNHQRLRIECYSGLAGITGDDDEDRDWRQQLVVEVQSMGALLFAHKMNVKNMQNMIPRSEEVVPGKLEGFLYICAGCAGNYGFCIILLPKWKEWAKERK